MSRPRYRLFLKCFGMVVLPVIAVVALCNLIIDPFEAYPGIHIKALKPYRSQGETRIAKAEAYLRGRWDLVILGNSVADGGIDPRSKAWGDRRVFNFSLRGIPVPEMWDQVDFILAHDPPAEIVVGLTFNLLCDPRPNRFEFLESRLNPSMTTVEYHLRNMLGLFATEASIDVLQAMAKNRPGESHTQGFSAGNEDGPYQSRNVRFVFAGNFRAGAAPHFRQGAQTIAERMAVLDDIVRRCRRAGVDVSLVVLPTHWTDLLAVRELGWWPRYEEFMCSLAKIGAGVGEGDRGSIRVISFAGVNEITTEPIPPAGEAPPMRWFHDPGHFKPALGERIIEELMTGLVVGRDLNKMDDVSVFLKELRVALDRQAAVSHGEAELVRQAVRESIHVK